MYLTKRQEAGVQLAAKIIQERGYDAFLEFVRKNKEAYERKLQAQARANERKYR